MFKNFFSFTKKPAATQPETPHAAALRYPVRQVNSADPSNPFRVDGYDCLSFVRSRTVASDDATVNAQFTELRKHTGRSYVGSLPKDPVSIAMTLSYPGQQVRDGILCKARRLEEKWDIYLYDCHIYFCRSWTGALIYVAGFAHSGGKINVDTVWAAQEACGGNTEFAIREVDYLIKSHVMQKRVPHPLPPDLQQDNETIGQYSFSQYGQVCCFGTYADTLPWDMLKPASA